MTRFEVILRPVTIDDYDDIYELWNCEKQSKRALNPIDDSREGIERYLKRNPSTCFLAWGLDEDKIVGVILAGHDGRRGIIHHLCVKEEYRNTGVATKLVRKAEGALKEEGISKLFCVVYKDNDPANSFWQSQGYTIRTNINYRNKSLNEDVPQGE